MIENATEGVTHRRRVLSSSTLSKEIGPPCETRQVAREVNWLQTAIAVEHLNPINRSSTYRVSPSAEVRLTPNFRLQFSTRNVYAATDSRTYSVQLQVKAQ